MSYKKQISKVNHPRDIQNCFINIPPHSSEWITICYIIQLCSGITGGRVLNGERYAQIKDYRS